MVYGSGSQPQVATQMRVAGVWRSVAGGFYGELDNYERNKNLYKICLRLEVLPAKKCVTNIIVFVLIISEFRLCVSLHMYFVLLSYQGLFILSYLNEELCLACFVYLILSQKYWIWQVTLNIL
jgi:hypothetical protein